MRIRSTAVVFLALASGSVAVAATQTANVLPATRVEVPDGTKEGFAKRAVPSTLSKIQAQGEDSPEDRKIDAMKKAGTGEYPTGRKLKKRDAVLGRPISRDHQPVRRSRKRLVRRFVGSIARGGATFMSTKGMGAIKDTAKWLLKNPTAIAALSAAGGTLLKGAVDDDNDDMRRAMAAAAGGFATPFYGGAFPQARDGSSPYSSAENEARVANAAAYGAAIAAAMAAGQPFPIPSVPGASQMDSPSHRRSSSLDEQRRMDSPSHRRPSSLDEQRLFSQGFAPGS